jgi:apolipoprotein N-acyltransferase
LPEKTNKDRNEFAAFSEMREALIRKAYPFMLIASAGLFPLAFPQYGWWPVILLSLGLLLAVVRDVRAGFAFFCGLLHGFLAYGIALYWMWNIFSVFALVMFLLMGFFTALFCLFFNWSVRYMKSPFWHVLLAAVFWTALEYFRSEILVLRFPWISVGSSFGPSFLSPMIGVYGATFLLVATSACFMARKTIIAGLALLLIVAGLGVFRLPPVSIDPDGMVRITLVQDESSQLERYVELTNESEGADSELIIWPEYALPYDIRQNISGFNQLKQLSRQKDALLLVGTQTKTGAAASAWHNTALLVGPEGAVGEYYKNRPVHFFWRRHCREESPASRLLHR